MKYDCKFVRPFTNQNNMHVHCTLILKLLFFLIVEMFEAFHNCVPNINTQVFLLDVVYNIKEWLEANAQELHSHTEPKCFKFVRNTSGKCEMYYRNYSHGKGQWLF